MLFLSSFTNTLTHTARIQTHTYCRHRHTCTVRTYISLGSFFRVMVEVYFLQIYRNTRTLHGHRHTHITRIQTHTNCMYTDTGAHYTHAYTARIQTHTHTYLVAPPLS